MRMLTYATGRPNNLGLERLQDQDLERVIGCVSPDAGGA
jgi:hypothetical protein